MVEPINVLVIRDQCEVSMDGQAHQVLAFDLRDVLEALGAEVDALNWRITNLDCHGGESESFCRRLDEAPVPGLWLSGAELRAFAENVDQVVDGTFVGFCKETDTQSLDPEDLEATAFPQSPSRLVIRAVDSSWFEIYTKDFQTVQLIRNRFRDVSVENPTDFFARFVSEAS